MRKRWGRTFEELKVMFVQKHGKKYDYSKAVYINCKTKIKIICPEHGEFFQAVYTHLKNGCPGCGRINEKKIKTMGVDYYVSRARKFHGNKYDYSKIDLSSQPELRPSEKYVTIICPIHGEFIQRLGDHSLGVGCKACAMDNMHNVVRKSVEDFIERGKKVHGDIYDYSKSHIGYEHRHKKIEIICKKHGSFFQSPHHHNLGRGCPPCSYEKGCVTKERFLERSKAAHGDKYDYSNVEFQFGYEKVCIVCKKHGKFYQDAQCHMSGKGCKKCTSMVSKPEVQFLDFIGVDKKSRQVKIGLNHVDGVDSENKIIYEFLGDYWHGNPKIYSPEKVHPVSKMTYGELYKKTIDRFDKLTKLGYRLMYIWEKDWKEWRKAPVGHVPILSHKGPVIIPQQNTEFFIYD